MHIEWQMMLVEALGFLLVYLFLSRIIFPGIKKTLEDRKQKIADDLAHADRMKKDMETLRAQYEESLGHIEDERRELIRESVKRAEEIRAELLAKAETDIAKLKERATRDIQVEVEKAMKAMREQVVQNTVLATTQLVKAEMNEARQRSLVEAFLNKIDQAEM